MEWCNSTGYLSSAKQRLQLRSMSMIHDCSESSRASVKGASVLGAIMSDAVQSAGM